MTAWLTVLGVGWALAQEGPLRLPVRELEHPRYLDANDTPVPWREVAAVARRTDVMGGIRRRRLGKNVLRVLFCGAAAAEAYGTVKLVERESDWAWVLGAQAGLTGAAGVLLFTEIPRNRRIERAEMLRAANAWWNDHGGVRGGVARP